MSQNNSSARVGACVEGHKIAIMKRRYHINSQSKRLMSVPTNATMSSLPPQSAGPDSNNKATSLILCDQENDDPIETLTPSEGVKILVHTPCFEGFEEKHMSFLYTTPLTSSDVLSTVITSRPIDTTVKRRAGYKKHQMKNNQECEGTTETSTHVYALPCKPRKVKKKDGKYKAQLPSFRRSLPALPIPIARLNQELLQERDKFMRQLHQEREEKRRLDDWAATKIQACYRGFRTRPRKGVHEKTRHRLNTLSSIRFDLSDMEESLKKNGSYEVPFTSTEIGSVPSWRKEIEHRAVLKHDVAARKQQQQIAASKIQACVRRYIARVGFVQLLSRHYDEVYTKAVVKIQSYYRGYRLRSKIQLIAKKLQQQAAIQIQSLVRGIQARGRVCTRRFEKKCAERRQSGQPLQFTLPNRTKDIVYTSILRCLYENRKSRDRLEFKNAKWLEERMYLHMHKVSSKLHVQRQWLLRWSIQLPPSRHNKKQRQGGNRKNSISGSLTEATTVHTQPGSSKSIN